VFLNNMLSKKIKANRIKPKLEKTFGAKKPFAGKNKNRTGSLKSAPINFVSKNKCVSPGDKEYLNWLDANRSNYGCFVCGRTFCNEWHHVKLNSSDKKDHTKLIALCGEEHHRLGQTLSAHGTPKKWRETYSMELQLEVADKIYQDYIDSKMS